MEYLILLRFIHIVSAIFWAGSIMLLAWYIGPSVKALGPDGGKFMQQLTKTNKYPVVMLIAGTLTNLGGILLIQQLSGGFQSSWFGTPHGIIISMGGTFSLIAFIIGLTVNLPTIKKMNVIGAAMAAAGGPPSAEQQQQLLTMRNKVFKMTNIMAGMVFLAAIAMSIVRYF
jgi:putative copper export protein